MMVVVMMMMVMMVVAVVVRPHADINTSAMMMVMVMMVSDYVLSGPGGTTLRQTLIVGFSSGRAFGIGSSRSR